MAPAAFRVETVGAPADCSGRLNNVRMEKLFTQPLIAAKAPTAHRADQ